MDCSYEQAQRMYTACIGHTDNHLAVELHPTWMLYTAVGIGFVLLALDVIHEHLLKGTRHAHACRTQSTQLLRNLPRRRHQ